MIESAPERLDIKRQLYTKVGPLAPEQTIFATNSSTLLPSDLADATGRPDRFLALHFANEIWIHNIAEIMGHPGTDPAIDPGSAADCRPRCHADPIGTAADRCL